MSQSNSDALKPAESPRIPHTEISLDVAVKPGTHARIQLADDPFIKLFLPRFLVVARPNFGEFLEPPERMEDKVREEQLWDAYKGGRRQAAKLFAVPDDVMKIWLKMAVAQHKEPQNFKVNHLASAYVPLQLVAGYLAHHQEVQPQTMAGFLESIKPLNADERAIVDGFMQRREKELGVVVEGAKTFTQHQPLPSIPKAESFMEKAKPVALSTRVEKSNASISVKIAPRIPHNPQIAGVAVTISATGAEDVPLALLTDKKVMFEQALQLVEEGLQRTENMTQFNQWLSGKFAEQHKVAEVRGR